jgi:hypothetical protein
VAIAGFTAQPCSSFSDRDTATTYSSSSSKAERSTHRDLLESLPQPQSQVRHTKARNPRIAGLGDDHLCVWKRFRCQGDLIGSVSDTSGAPGARSSKVAFRPVFWMGCTAVPAYDKRCGVRLKGMCWPCYHYWKDGRTWHNRNCNPIVDFREAPE